MKGYKKYSKFIATVMLAAFLLPQIAWAQPYPDLRKSEVGTVGDIFIDGLRVDVDNSVYNYGIRLVVVGRNLTLEQKQKRV